MHQLQVLASELSSMETEGQQRVRHKIGDSVYHFVQSIDPDRAAQVTGMIISAPTDDIAKFVQSKRSLRSAVEGCIKALKALAQ